MEGAPIHLAFDGGTLVVSGAEPQRLATLPGCRLDPRSGGYRAEARHYRAIVESLRRQHWPYEDEARAYQPTPWALRTTRDPFPHQLEALETWWQKNGQGVVVLPTGTGKTHLAILAIQRAGRPVGWPGLPSGFSLSPWVTRPHPGHSSATTFPGLRADAGRDPEWCEGPRASVDRRGPHPHRASVAGEGIRRWHGNDGPLRDSRRSAGRAGSRAASPNAAVRHQRRPGSRHRMPNGSAHLP